MQSILVVTELFEIGGLETHLRGEIVCLSRNGCEVHLATGTRFDGSLLPVDVASVTSGLKLGPEINWTQLLDTVAALRGLIRARSIELVHAHPFTSLVPGMLAAELEHVPFAITLHGPASLASCYGPMHAFLLETSILPEASLVICVSRETAEIASVHLASRPAVVLANGVDHAAFSQAVDGRDPQGQTGWLVVSRLDRAKAVGIEDFVRKAARAGLPGISIAGDGPARDALEQSLAADGLAGYVRFLGARTDVAALMAAAAGVAGMGRVVLEGLASRRPVFLVGYDGVKGLLDPALTALAAHSNFSGRNLPTIDDATFRDQASRVATVDIDALHALIGRDFCEQYQWDRFLAVARTCVPPGPTLLGDLYRGLLADGLTDSGPYLASNEIADRLGRLVYSPRHFSARLSGSYENFKGVLMKNHDASAAGFLAINQSRMEINRLEQALADRDAGISTLEQQLADGHARLEQQDAELDTCKQALEARDETLSGLSEQLAQHEQRALQSEAQLNRVLSSHSWKVTGPLRVARRVLSAREISEGNRAKLFLYGRAIYRSLPLPFKYKHTLRRLFFRFANAPSLASSNPQISGLAASIGPCLHADASPSLPTPADFRSIDGVRSRDIPTRIAPYFGVRRPHGKRRAAILTNQLLDWHDGRPRFGGGERYALELARLLRELSIEVTFFQPTLGSAESGEYYSFEVRFLPVGDAVGEFNHAVCTGFTQLTEDYDHVYHHLPEYASGRVREDAIMTCHGIWFDHDNYPDAIFRTRPWFEHLYHAFHSPSAVVSVDTNSIGFIRSLWPALASRMKFIPNFFDQTSYHPDVSRRNDKRLTVLFPRRSQINRGSRIFGDIVAMIPHDVDIVWLGEGDPVDTEIVKAVCRQDSRASFHVADFDQMQAWYQRADIVVIPTIACEGTSLSCIEALACGCAVVSTNVGGLPDLVHDELNGLLVDPNAVSLSRAINRLVVDTSLREQLQRTAARTATNFELGAWRARWVEMLHSQGWIDDDTVRQWRLRASPTHAEDTTEPAQRWVILTRNAIHGGVESMIREQREQLNAPVIVCGGHDRAETCPFPYSRADNRRTLESAIAEYDVILYHWIPDWALEVVRKSKKHAIEFIHRTDTSVSDKTVPTAIVTHSAFLARYVFETYGRFCRVVDHPIAVQRFLPQPRLGNCIGAITSYYETKGIDVFLRAWALLKSEFPDVSVRLYGEGEDLPRFKKLAAELNIDAEFLPATLEPWEAMKAFRCFVVPSRIEGLPVAVLEALAAEIPVVASALPGMVEFNALAVKRGYERYITLANPEDPEDLARVLRQQLTSGHRPGSQAYIREYYRASKHCGDLMDIARGLRG